MKTLTAILRRWVAVGFALAATMVSLPGQTRPVSPDRVTFYSEPDFKGQALTVEAGASVPDLNRMQRDGTLAWGYAISSVQVEGNARAVVYTNAGLQGERLEIAQNIPDLFSERRTNGATWDRTIASVAVVGPRRVIVAEAPPPPPPPPQTVIVVPANPPPVMVQPVRRISPYEAEAMVRSAYREVLARNPDPQGMQRYRDLVLRDGWTERDIIQALQRSSEARSISPDAAITRMYREVLGRDPDPNGLAHYRQLWREGWTQGQILDDLRHSAERAANRGGRR